MNTSYCNNMMTTITEIFLGVIFIRAKYAVVKS